MPIVGWWCKQCRLRVALDHFETACNSVHPDYAAAVLADSRKERAAGIHVTGVLNCPRKSALEHSANVYVDPLAYNAILSGTAWHELMESASVSPELCEVEVRGVVAGVPLVGKIDRLHPPTAISDWKRTSEWAEKWLSKPKDEGGGMKAEHLAQLSLYGELVEQSFGWRPAHGIIWYSTHKSMLYFAEQLWPLEQVLGFKPLDGDYTVAELIKQADQYAQWNSPDGAALRREWQDLPLAGQSMKYGAKTACDYCAVRETCFEQAFGAPF